MTHSDIESRLSVSKQGQEYVTSMVTISVTGIPDKVGGGAGGVCCEGLCQDWTYLLRAEF